MTTDVKFSPDGSTFAATSDGHYIKIFSSDTSEELSTLKCEDCVNAVAFSPDGRTIAAAVYTRETGCVRMILFPGCPGSVHGKVVLV